MRRSGGSRAGRRRQRRGGEYGRLGWAGSGAACGPRSRPPPPGLLLGTARAGSRWRRSPRRREPNQNGGGPFAGSAGRWVTAARGPWRPRARRRSGEGRRGRGPSPRRRRAPLSSARSFSQPRNSPSPAPPPPGTLPAPPHAVAPLPSHRRRARAWGPPPAPPAHASRLNPASAPAALPPPASVRRGSLPAPAAPAGHASPRRFWRAAPRPQPPRASVVCVSTSFLLHAAPAIAPALGVRLPRLPSLPFLGS